MLEPVTTCKGTGHERQKFDDESASHFHPQPHRSFHSVPCWWSLFCIVRWSVVHHVWGVWMFELKESSGAKKGIVTWWNRWWNGSLQVGTEPCMLRNGSWHVGTDAGMLRNGSWQVGRGSYMLRNGTWHAQESTMRCRVWCWQSDSYHAYED